MVNLLELQAQVQERKREVPYKVKQKVSRGSTSILCIQERCFSQSFFFQILLHAELQYQTQIIFSIGKVLNQEPPTTIWGFVGLWRCLDSRTLFPFFLVLETDGNFCLLFGVNWNNARKHFVLLFLARSQSSLDLPFHPHHELLKSTS